MRVSVNFLLFGLQLSVCRAVVCPSPYKAVFGVCLHRSSTTMTWCDAQAFCTSAGGELVRGNNFLPLNGKAFPGYSGHYWVGLTDLLEERRKQRSNWRWTDGSLDPQTSGLAWIAAWEPGNVFGQDCGAQCRATKLCDSSCGSTWRLRSSRL